MYSLPEQIKRKLLKIRQILQKELRKQLQKQIQKRKNRLDIKKVSEYNGFVLFKSKIKVMTVSVENCFPSERGIPQAESSSGFRQGSNFPR